MKIIRVSGIAAFLTISFAGKVKPSHARTCANWTIAV